MATIQINSLTPAGSDLFSDDESYLKELSDSDLNAQGGVAASTIWIEAIYTITLRVL